MSNSFRSCAGLCSQPGGGYQHVAAGVFPSSAARWASLLQALLLILPLMWVWSMTAYSTARFEPRRLAVQVMVLVTAFGVLLLGVVTPKVFDGSAWMFAGVYVALQAGRALVVAVALRSHWLQRLYWGRVCCTDR